MPSELRFYDAFDQSRPYDGIPTSNYRRPQPNTIAAAAYEAIRRDHNSTTNPLDYELAANRNQLWEELFQHESERVR